MFAEKVIELLKEAERNPVTIDPFNVCCFIDNFEPIIIL